MKTIRLICIGIAIGCWASLGEMAIIESVNDSLPLVIFLVISIIASVSIAFTMEGYDGPINPYL